MYRGILKRCLLAFVVISIVIQLTPDRARTEDTSDLTADDAGSALKVLDPNIRILSVKPAPVAGLWEVIVETKGQKSIVYLDSPREKVIVGSVVDLNSRVNLTKQRFDEINRIDISQIPLDDALVMGDPKAKHTVIVFDDPD
jgi:thiol:disulfide interchange protein DsbC